MNTVFRSRVFSVEVGPRQFPDGREREVAIVRHPPSVVLIPFTEDGHVMLVRQYRAPLDRHTWEFPAGGVNPGESAEIAAARECEEEIALVPDRIERLGSWYPVPGYCDEELIFYRVSALRSPAPDSRHHADEDENITAKAFTLDDVRAMVRRGEIVDLKTAFASGLV